MGASERKKELWFSGLTAARWKGIAGILGLIGLLGLFACQQTGGVRPSAATADVKAAAKEGPPPLLDSQCVLCHPDQSKMIAERGKKHKTEVGCQDCHTAHPPQGTGGIPQCSMCHSGKPHYELEQCSSCHSDTHAPLDMKLEGELTAACLTCHAQQGKEVKEHPSAHTDVPCNECHAAHREIPECTQCHEKHTPDMDFKACVSCHPVHMPLVIAYGPETPSPWCGACHQEAMDLLAKNQTKHHALSCAFCHKDKHKTIPPCSACHPNPHPDGILKKFPDCGQCHGIAHDLKG